MEQTADRPCLLIIADLDQTQDQPRPLAIKEKRAAFKALTKRGGFLEKFLVDRGNHGLVVSTYGFQSWGSFPVRRRAQSFPLPGLTADEIQDLAAHKAQPVLPRQAVLIREFSLGHEGLVDYLLTKNAESGSQVRAALAGDMEPEEDQAAFAQTSLEYLEALLRENLPKELVDRTPQLLTTMARPHFGIRELVEDLHLSLEQPAQALQTIGQLSSVALIHFQTGEGYVFISPLREIADYAQTVIEHSSSS